MFKKVFLRLILIVVFAILIGCSEAQSIKNEEKNIKNEEKIILNQTAEKKVNQIKNSAIPDFEEIYESTVEIDVKFDPETVTFNSNGGFESTKIKDNKMLSDILTMIGNSELITDESKINNMSGMATKNNYLILVASDGSKKEINFAFDDPAFAVGYLKIDDKKYDPGFSFFRYIRDFTEYRQYDPNIDNQVEELFRKYGWTIDYRINTIDETLPSDLKHEAGEYPLKIYWAYNNELSKSIGLDYSDCLGKEVEVEIYRLREPLPEYMFPRMNARGIGLKYDKKIVGAYIDAGRHDCFACALDRKSFKDITNKEWDNWICDYIDYDNDLEIRLSKMTAEDVIKQYYDAINSHDQKRQFACMTRRNICNYLALNMDNNLLFNEGFDNAYVDGEQNVKSAKLISLKEASSFDNPKGSVEYAAIVNFKFKKEITTDSGKQTRFIILKKESDKSGWRISSEGTGP
jgi:hypothetical protein